MHAQAGGRGDATVGVSAGQAGLVGERLPSPVRPPVRVQVPGRPVRVPRSLAAAAGGLGVLEHGSLPAAGADPPDSRAQPAIVRQFLGDGARRIDSDALQQLAGRRDHRAIVSLAPQLAAQRGRTGRRGGGAGERGGAASGRAAVADPECLVDPRPSLAGDIIIAPREI